MAVTQTIIKNTHQEVVVKVEGTAATSTVNLATLSSVNQVLDGATQTVNIIGVTWTGDSAGLININRNGINIMTLISSQPGFLDFSGQNMVPDTIQNTQNIDVVVSGGVAQIWIRLRKIGGYKPTVELAQFGAYDNPAVAGS